MHLTVDLPGDRPAGALARVAMVVEILATYFKARRVLKRTELPAAVATLRRTARVAPPRALEEEVATGLRLGRAVTRSLSALPTDSRCLTSSLVLLRVLERRGIHPRFVLAVRGEPEFAAHAWIEHGGRALLAPGLPPFKRLLEL